MLSLPLNSSMFSSRVSGKVQVRVKAWGWRLAKKTVARLLTQGRFGKGQGCCSASVPFQSRQCSTLVPLLVSHEILENCQHRSYAGGRLSDYHDLVLFLIAKAQCSHILEPQPHYHRRTSTLSIKEGLEVNANVLTAPFW